ncbi:MAG: ribose 5-phosphate isomerase A [Legionellales bacterium]|nr:ribose 5-phosphate isomerase A [Legionellales bacterium]
MFKGKQTKQQKQMVAQAALEYVPMDGVIGVGTGSTVEYFIEALASIKHQIKSAVPSSQVTRDLLKKQGVAIAELNHVPSVDVYIDGADEFNPYLSLIKGGGGALTQEKIIAAASKQFVCIVDASKEVACLGKFPLPVEVLPMARSFVAREMVRLGGQPEYREGFVTDNGNLILDIYQLDLSEPMAMERQINNIPGVVTNGIFALRGADVVLIADEAVRQVCSRGSSRNES